MSVFTVFGLQRSGTNFLEQMISEHVGDLQLQNHWRGKTGIWKHAFNLEQNNVDEKIAGLRGDPQKAKLIGTEIKGVYVHKHPYAWIESILRKNILKKDALIITERSSDEKPEDFEELEMIKNKNYGNSLITIYKLK